MRPHRVVVLDVLTKHPPQMPFVDGDDVIEALAPERPDHPLGDGVGVRRAHRSQNRLDPDPSSAVGPAQPHQFRPLVARQALSVALVDIGLPQPAVQARPGDPGSVRSEGALG